MTSATGQTAATPHPAPLPARTPGPTRDVFPPPAARPPGDHRDQPGTYTRADLGPDRRAAARARRLTRDALARWHLDNLADEAEIIASELITNAVNVAVSPRGTLPTIIFALHRRPDELRIIVWDNGPGIPCSTDPDPDAETGRGLTIIASLTRQKWGWWTTPLSGGKVVWAALPLHPPAD